MKKEDIMEENKDGDIIYDLESSASHAEAAGGLGAQSSSEESDSSENSENSDGSENSEKSEKSEKSDSSENSENSEKSDSSEKSENSDSVCKAEIDRMVEEMGAETLLEIIRDNRNAAIRQIISEVEASRDESLPSGVSGAASCSSIFDLAALA